MRQPAETARPHRSFGALVVGACWHAGGALQGSWSSCNWVCSKSSSSSACSDELSVDGSCPFRWDVRETARAARSNLLRSSFLALTSWGLLACWLSIQILLVVAPLISAFLRVMLLRLRAIKRHLHHEGSLIVMRELSIQILLVAALHILSCAQRTQGDQSSS